jgi:hypothetical protein
MKIPAWLKTNRSRHLTLAVFAAALFAFGILITPRGYACANDTAPGDYCNYVNITVTYTGTGTVDNQAVRAIFNGTDLIATDTINNLAWDLRPYIGVLSNEVNVEAQSLTSNSSGFWFQIPTISSGETRVIRQLMGSNEQKRDQGVLMTGGETITTPDDDALDLLDLFTSRVSLILLDDTARNETIVEHHDGTNGWRIDLVDNGGSLEVQCTVDATTVSIAFDASWVDTVRDFACELDSLVDGLTITEEVSGTTASTAAGPIGAAVAVDMVVGDDSLTSAIVLDFRLLDNRVRMSSLGVPTVIIDRFVLGAVSASETLTVDTTGLPFTARHLVLSCSTAAVLGTPNLLLRINGDSGAAYNYQTLTGAGAVAAAARTNGATSQAVGILGTTANVYASSEVLFTDALSTRSHKASIALHGNAEAQVATVAARYAQSLAVVSITVFTSTGVDLAAGSICDLAVVDERYAVDEQILTVPDTFDFTDVPITNGYNVVIGNLRGANASATVAQQVQFNGDTTGTNYFKQQLGGFSTTTNANAGNDNFLGTMPADSGTAGAFGAFFSTWQNGYIAANDPHHLTLSGYHESSGPNSHVQTESLRRDNVERIHRVRYFPNAGTNWVADSMATLYFVPTTTQSVVELDVAAASITFSGIDPAPAARVSMYGRSDRASVVDDVAMEFNGDGTAANYDYQRLVGTGAGVAASTSAADSSITAVAGDSAAANSFGGGTIWLPNFASTDRHKSHISIAGSPGERVALNSNRWEDTSPITDAVLSPVVGTVFNAGTVAMLETVDGYGTVVRYGYDAVGMNEATAVDPTYTGTFDGYGDAALTANYTFTRDQSDWEINVGPLIPANVNPGPVDPDELLDILGDPFGDLIDTTVAEDVTGIFYDYFVIPVNALDPIIGRQFAWTLLMGGFAIVFMVASYMPFKQAAVSVFCAGIPLVYGATQGYMSWWWVIFWMIMVPVAWFATKQAQEA